MKPFDLQARSTSGWTEWNLAFQKPYFRTKDTKKSLIFFLWIGCITNYVTNWNLTGKNCKSVSKTWRTILNTVINAWFIENERKWNLAEYTLYLCYGTSKDENRLLLKYEQVGMTSVSSTCMLLKNDTLGLLCLNTDCFDI